MGAPLNDADTASLSATGLACGESGSGRSLHLELLWSKEEGHRVGECCNVSRATLLGRGPTREPGDPPKSEFFRQRPGVNEPTGALNAPTASRRQWVLTPHTSGLQVDNIGKPELLHNGLAVRRCVARPGDTLGVEGTALFLLTERTRVLPQCDYAPFAFGATDSFGIVGESEIAWKLRRQLAQLARASAHVLVLGASGSGKELCARALHHGSPRQAKTFVSRNAATIPSGIIEAELFGNAANYPNSGMPARAGLIGAADGGTLFVDEIAELPERDQATFLRVLDAGEYQRLGEERVRKCDLRVLAATNRPPESLKFDLLARFQEHLHVPDLNQRRADIPLIANQVLGKLASEFAASAPKRPSLELIDTLVRHSYTTNVRELEQLLRLVLRESSGADLRISAALSAQVDLPSCSVELSADAIRCALAESKSVKDAAKRLGLPSRFALHRLMKKLGVSPVEVQ